MGAVVLKNLYICLKNYLLQNLFCILCLFSFGYQKQKILILYLFYFWVKYWVPHASEAQKHTFWSSGMQQYVTLTILYIFVFIFHNQMASECDMITKIKQFFRITSKASKSSNFRVVLILTWDGNPPQLSIYITFFLVLYLLQIVPSPTSQPTQIKNSLVLSLF